MGEMTKVSQCFPSLFTLILIYRLLGGQRSVDGPSDGSGVQCSTARGAQVQWQGGQRALLCKGSTGPNGNVTLLGLLGYGVLPRQC